MPKTAFLPVIKMLATLSSYSMILLENTTTYFPHNTTIQNLPFQKIPSLRKMMTLPSMPVRSTSFPQCFYIADGVSIMMYHIGPSLRLDLVANFTLSSPTNLQQVKSIAIRKIGFYERVAVLIQRKLTEEDRQDFLEVFDIMCVSKDQFRVNLLIIS